MFQILHFGVNFVCDLAQVRGSKVHCPFSILAVDNDPLEDFL